VVNLHREGYIALPSLRSARAAVAAAVERGRSARLLIVIDSGDELTTALARRWARADEIVEEVDFRDLALARNHAAARSDSEWVSYLDGDDLWHANWLTSALDAAGAETRQVVWHPELSIYFGARQLIIRHVDMDDSNFDVFNLVCSNLWTSLCMARRELLVANPYPKIDLGRKVGFEDWSWNREIIRAGAVHKTVKGTAHVIRSRPDSLGARSLNAGAMPMPTTLFREWFEKRARE
jgi:glycosyltransferase involved in cell wall biosynthesis